MKAGIDCYMRQETADELQISGHRLNVLSPGAWNIVKDWDVYCFETVHDVPGLGFCLGNREAEGLIYVTDSAYVEPRFAGITHLMIEANYSIDILNQNVAAGLVALEMKNRLLKNHFSLERVKDFLRANDLSQVQEIHLLHLSRDNSDEKLFKREIQALTGKPVYVCPERS